MQNADISLRFNKLFIYLHDTWYALPVKDKVFKESTIY